ncbi:MAG: carboxypeptidase-like regulatory domain-containing protein [Pyrinomonadaceae bacterium]
MLTLTKAVDPVPESPYRGIEPFRFIDQQIFAAREDETWTLLSNITIYRGVLLYGSSGSGKSSLINAGLLPAVLKERMMPTIFRVQPRLGKELKIERISTETDRQPPYLPSIFAQDEETFSFECSVDDVFARLQKLKEMPPDKLSSEPRPLLIFDQFEEFVTLFEEAARATPAEGAGTTPQDVAEARSKILQALTDIIQDESLPVKILFVFREDYLAKLDILLENCPELSDQNMHLVPPRIEAVSKIIRAPFENKELREKFLRQSKQDEAEISKDLAETIAAELGERSEGGFVNLSELQIVCKKLYESPNPEQLIKQLHVEGLIGQYWSDALAKLPDKVKTAAIALLGHLITSSNTRNIISEEDLINREKENFDEKNLREALDALVSNRMVRREPRHQVYFYEIVSEFLVPLIQRLKAGRQAEIARIEAQKELEKAEKRSRVWRWGVIGLAVILLAAIAAGIQLYRLNATIKKNEVELATKNKLLTDAEEKNRLLVTILTGSNSAEKIKAIEEAKRLSDSGQLSPEMKEALTNAAVGIYVSGKDKDVTGAASELLDTTVKNDSDLSKSLETVTSKLPPRVYIQIADNNQRTRATSIKLALERRKFVVPAFELVDSNHAPKKENELRYCPDPEGDQLNPADILNDIKNADTSKDWKLVPSRLLCAGTSKVRANHYEIWFSNSSTTGQQPVETALGTFYFRIYVDRNYTIDNTTLRVKVTMKSKTDPQAPVITRETDGRKVTDILVGDYSVTIEASGFNSSEKSDVKIRPGSQREYVFDLNRIGFVPPRTAEPARSPRPRAVESNQPPRRQNP